MKVTRLSKSTIEVRCEYSADNNVFNFLLTSDVHFDNPKCVRSKYFKDLDRAREVGAKIFCFGDLMCLMQGRYDGRATKSDIRDEHKGSNYLDLVINDTADQHRKYADLFIAFTDGNHETSITKHCETDPLERFVERLNTLEGTDIHRGRYQGFIIFKFQQNGARVRTITLFYHHGKFGGIVTKGTLGVLRQAAVVPDADIIVNGHTHDRWYMEQPRYKLNQSGEAKVEPQYHIKTGCYKEEFEDMKGFAVEKIVLPKSIGGMWLTIDLSGRDARPKIRISNDL